MPEEPEVIEEEPKKPDVPEEVEQPEEHPDQDGDDAGEGE